MDVRAVVYFSGTVQGVGFRFTTLTMSKRHAVTGTVENLPDGRVKLVAEGGKGEILALVEDVEAGTAGHVSKRDIEFGTATGEFEGFEILR
jgi:acylphosphatase